MSRQWSTKKEDFLRSSVGFYQGLSPTAPPIASAPSCRVSTPCVPGTHEHAPAAVPNADSHAGDQSGGDPADAVATEIHTAVARVILKGMHAARMARPDLLRTVAQLARFPT